jgi:hypothetical protein
MAAETLSPSERAGPSAVLAVAWQPDPVGGFWSFSALEYLEGLARYRFAEHSAEVGGWPDRAARGPRHWVALHSFTGT